MLTLRYTFDDEDFDYDVEYSEIKQRLSAHIAEYYTKEELIKHLIDNDGCVINLNADFLEDIHYLFYKDAERWFYESKQVYNEYNQEDFV